jgi:hypothetical protein
MLKRRAPSYQRFVKVPAKRIGDFEVRHVVKHDALLSTANPRTRMLAGHPEHVMHFKGESVWHHLIEHDGDKEHALWMTDYPIEQFQHDRVLEKMHGSVLVGGLGLGYAIKRLRKLPGYPVKRIVCVEKSRDVRRLVWKHMRGRRSKDQPVRLECVNADLFDYLEQTDETFDFAFYDIWASDGQHTFYDTVVPLREKTHDLGIVEDPGNVVCWNEDIMRAQVQNDLFFRALQTTVTPWPNKSGGRTPSNHPLQMSGMQKIEPEQWATPIGNFWHDRFCDYFAWFAAQPKLEREATLGDTTRIFTDRHGIPEAEWEPAAEAAIAHWQRRRQYSHGQKKKNQTVSQG